MYSLLIPGFPGKLDRGYLGWSSVVLVRDSSASVLFDTGNWGDRPVLLDRLARLGVYPRDIHVIVLSHLHFDHVASVECFPRARVLVHEREVAYFEEFAGRDPALPVYQVESMLSRRCVERLDGDGGQLTSSLRWVHTPGHTPGHVSLVLDNGAASPVVFAGDAIKHRVELERCAQEQAWDPAESARSIEKIRGTARLIIPGHDSPLLLENGRAVVSSPARETLTVTYNGRRINLEA